MAAACPEYMRPVAEKNQCCRAASADNKQRPLCRPGWSMLRARDIRNVRRFTVGLTHVVARAQTLLLSLENCAEKH